MPRPLRFEYPGALYHIINRGNYRHWIFKNDGAKASFEKCLFEACERSGWVLHAYCVMSNHFHLALETPEGNLSEGMRWLQGTFAMRYNKYRKEHGHLFQGRFKSIIVEDFERLAWLCHYIHLNPVRAELVTMEDLWSYRYSSLHWMLQSKKERPQILSVASFLAGCGGLRDGSKGRSKYLEYLSWLQEDEPRQKALLFDRMSKGWAHGSTDFKNSLLEDAKREVADRITHGTIDPEARELLWEERLKACLSLLGKSIDEINSDSKSADWKIAICGFLRRTSLCRNRWLSEHLNMGVDAGISRCMKRLRDGERPQAAKLERLLDAKIKY